MFGIGFDIDRTLLWIVLLPLLGALVNGVAGGKAPKIYVSAVAVGSVFGAFLLSLVGFGYLLNAGEEGRQLLDFTAYDWFSIAIPSGPQGVVEVPVRVRFVMDHLSGIMAVMVSGVGALIHVYSVGYMQDDPGYARFMTYLNLFMASMLILVLASNLPLMFVGWEGVGLCSYLLIGFWYTNGDYAAAGRKAFVVNRIGDFGVLIAMFLLVRSTHSFEFADINEQAQSLPSELQLGGMMSLGVGVPTIASLFIFLGCAGKSAQIPLYVWLPDAMAGPTPVSALIHAATMVTAGVYLCARLSFLLVQSPVAMSVIAIVGALTALLAASIALVQNQMKRVLAYSTVSQLGFMFAAVGSGAFAAGMFHVFTHAFFKACLFLGAGSVMHAVHAHGDADIRYLGGLKKWLPKTHATFFVATMAISGVPLLSGFFSKDEILLGTLTWGAVSPELAWVGYAVFAMLAITAAMTAFYMFRLYFRTFHGEFKGGHAPHEGHAEHDEHEEDHEPHESPDTMTVPLYVLAGGSAIVGLLGLPHLLHLPNWWASWLTPQYERFLAALHEGGAEAEAVARANDAAHEVANPAVATLAFRDPVSTQMELIHGPSWVALGAMAIGTLAAVVGIGLAYSWYFQRDGEPAEALKARMPGLHKILMNKWYVDELYGSTVIAFNKWLGVFAANVDRFFVDGILAGVTAAAVKASGFVITRTQTGAVYAYAGMFVLGLAGLGWWFTYPHPSLRGQVDGATVSWEAGRGLGYEYRWDFDSDGEFEVDWSEESAQTHAYEAGASYRAIVAVLTFSQLRTISALETLRGRENELEIVLTPTDDPEELPEDVLGYAMDGEESRQPPTVRYRIVHRHEGSIPENRVPRPDEEGQRLVEVELSLYDAAQGGGRVWGPERQRVSVQESGEFAILLGAELPVRPSRLARRLFVETRVGDARVGERVRFDNPRPGADAEGAEPGFEHALLVRINDVPLRDTDGVNDGLATVAVGETVRLGSGSTLTSAVCMRATVEVRNAFGNRSQSYDDVTLRLNRTEMPTAAEPQAAADLPGRPSGRSRTALVEHTP